MFRGGEERPSLSRGEKGGGAANVGLEVHGVLDHGAGQPVVLLLHLIRSAKSSTGFYIFDIL